MRLLSTFLSVLLTPLMAVMPLQAEMPNPLAEAEASIPGNVNVPVAQNSLQIKLAGTGQVAVQASSSLKGYSILVTDSSGLPVADAAVALRLPEEGPTGFFSEGVHSAVAYTDATGVATFPQINWGATPGTVSIRVTAVKGDLRAGSILEQTLVISSGATAASTAQIAKPATTVTSKAAPPTPGTPASVTSVHSGATPDQLPSRSAETAASPEPVVSIVNTAGNKGTAHGSTKKWIILAAVAVGAGVGAAMAMAGKGGSTPAAASPGVSIGTPTISVGH